MTRILLALTTIGVLASCAQYQEPQANCFSFLPPKVPQCNFSPLGAPEREIEV
jgi:hypothetical protein